MKKIKINKKKGILFWITGLSGSGKTTFGQAIHKDIQKFQNMGYGKLLVEYLISLNLKNIFVEVSSNNINAIMFYHRLNFLKIGLRKNYYKKQKSDAILLKLENVN